MNGNHLEDGVEQTVPIMTTTIASTESPMDVGVPVFTDVMSGASLYEFITSLFSLKYIPIDIVFALKVSLFL